MALRLLIVLLILAVPLELPGCGPFLPEALFQLKGAPDAPKEFARGQLGILQPSYRRVYLVIAYRYLAGIGLSDAEAQAISPWPKEAVEATPSEWFGNPWLAARNKVPEIKQLNYIDSYRVDQTDGTYSNYHNCNDDAFVTAAATLQRIRSKTYAADWIAAQDMVFADCSQGAVIPLPASDPQLRPDRAYQIAAAKFYSEQYESARQDFQTIAGDASSPWRDVAPYLATRCLIRAGEFDEADAELRRIAADPAMARWHASANGLLNYVRARLHPEERMHELALALVKPNSQASIGQDLIDYTALFDKDVKPSEGDDLTDWITSFQAGGNGALERWRATHSLAWLVAAQQSLRRGDAAVPELLAAAAAVTPDSPGYVTVNYRREQLLPDNDARTLTEQLLKLDLPPSARNQFRAEGLRLARTFDEFLHYASRTPVDFDAKPGVEVLDDDAAGMLDAAVPLPLLRQASTSPALPEKVRRGLQRVASIRALTLSPSPDFDAVFRLLHTPGDQPFVRAGYGRYTQDPGKIDDFRDNWWCPITGSTIWQPQPHQAPQPPPIAGFLPAPDRRQAADEWRKLSALPAAPDWLGAQTVAFAQRHPQDPRIPEALYLVVRSSRYGCTDAQTGDFSKRAFNLLHSRYPDSEWAKKTPYWYK